MAKRKAADRKQGRAPFTDRREGETLYRNTTTGTAQLIREALKKAFPAVKFSVTSSTFADGSSVDIAYTDGPSGKQVEQLCAPFISGHFNSQEDLYEYHQELTAINEAAQLARVSYGAKYISDRRSYCQLTGFSSPLWICARPRRWPTSSPRSTSGIATSATTCKRTGASTPAPTP